MFKLVLFICCVMCSASFVHPRRIRPQVEYSPELVQDLREFIDLIPSITIDELVAEHMLVDSDFRKAIKFLRSWDFKQLIKRAEQLPEVIEVINFAHLNDTRIKCCRFPNRYMSREDAFIQKTYGYEISGVSSKNDIIEGVVVVLINQNENQLHSTLGSLISFANELLTHLPRNRFVELINEKRQNGTVFPKFYEAIRSDEFKQLVDTTLKCRNVKSIISTLASHAIDAESLKGIAYEVISWGPAA